MRPRLPIATYPAVVVATICIHVWAVSGVSVFATTRSLAVGLIVAITLLAITRAILGERDAAGVLTLLLLLGLLVGGRPPALVLILIGVGLVAGERAVFRKADVDWTRVGHALMVCTAIVASGVLLEVVELGRLGDVATTLLTETPLRSTTAVRAAPSSPDVYVILLDGYARHDVLAERYGFDDSPFLDGLRARGFNVSDESHSNYLSTNPSLSSFLNYRHLADIPAVRPLLDDPTIPEGPSIHRAISHPAVIDRFEALGYETIALAPGFNQVSVRAADRFIDTGQITGFEIALLRTSIIPPIVTTVLPDAFSGSQRDRIEAIFESIERIAEIPADHPRFVLGHIPSPHAPWVHNADGSARTVSDLVDWYVDVPGAAGLTHDEVVAGYRSEAEYIGGRALATVDRLLAASERPPVILVVSDHGSFLDVTPSNAEVRLRNLFAAYTPGAPGLFPRDVTLIQTFPILFKTYFAIDLPAVDPTLYVSGPRGLYDLIPAAEIDPAGRND